jgi:glycosyltransferase involved in cell wall biosynthesis
LVNYPGRKIVVYHNITPFEYFYGYSRANYDLTYLGREGLNFLKDKVERCFADSQFNKTDLRETGYSCPIDVLPIIVPFDDYNKTPNQDILKQYDDDWVNILFVGRIAPNKKPEDIIRAFAYYKTHINPKSRLFLAGSYNGMETYHRQLQKYVHALGIKDVIFTGHTKFDQLLAFYKLADVFLCMSEHEGFCVPLLEAMHFDVPIVAYKAAAVPDTMGKSGIVVDEKNPALIGKLIERLVTDSALRQAVISGQQDRLKDFSYERTKETFKRLMADCI